MHYKRDEEPPVNPNLPIALDWFYNKAKGEPHLIAVDGRRTWVASPDRWSFGLGVVLGTMEGAFILNLKGMLVLELPGPRILIFVKAEILEPRPPRGKPADQTAGILAVVDMNFQAGYIAIGLIFKYEVKDLVRIEVPIDAEFHFPRRRRLAPLHRQHPEQGLGRDSRHREGHRLPDVRWQGDSRFSPRAAAGVLDRRRHRRIAR